MSAFFVQIPTEIARDDSLSLTARMLWVIGLSYAPNWLFRRDELKSRLGVSVNTMLAALKELRTRGLITGGFKQKNDPLRFHREPQNVQNLNVADSSQRSKSERSGAPQRSKSERLDPAERSKSERCNVQNLNDKNIKEEYQKNTTLAALDPAEGSDPRADDDTAPATVQDCLTIRPDRDATDPDEPSCQAKSDNSPLPELPDETPPAQALLAGWLEFVGRWNQTGQLPYTALQPTSVVTAGLLRLTHLYGRDGPGQLLARVKESAWLREHPHTLAWALREENITRVMDGEFSRKFSESTRSGKTQQAQRVAKCSREQVDLQW